MRDRIRTYISACFYYSGLVGLIRWWTRRLGPRLIILYYHRAAGGNLRSHLLYLRRHYRILQLEAALEELYRPREQQVQREDRRTLLALTFDDGYEDNFTHAFPLAYELHIPITIFLIAGHMERDSSFLPSEALEKKAAPLLTWAQVREMRESGWVSFGAHTMHHPDLSNLSDPAEVQREVGECRTVLEQQLACPIHSFSYPFGRIGDHGLRSVKAAGYKWAFTIIPGVNTCRNDPYLFRRISMDVNKHWLLVAAETTCIWNFFSSLKAGIVGHLL